MQLSRDIFTIRKFGKDIIQKRRQETLINSTAMGNNRADLLTYFMKIQDDQGKGFTDEELCDYVLNFIIAGRDTTAQALSWCI